MLRAVDKWLPGYIRSVLARPRRVDGPRHLMLCIADHYEPLGRGVSRSDGLAIVRRWVDEYPRTLGGFRDADGRPPRHTFFYPAEEYDCEVLDTLARLCRDGFGEVEIHLHHRNDTADGFRNKLVEFRDRLRREHGLLGSYPDGRPAYGFAHGNWALCNSRSDGDWCGVDEELGILKETGCYADFTFPSAPSSTQSRMVNALYYARDTSGKPRGHDRGIPTQVGRTPGESDLLLVTGPLALNWEERKAGIFPRLENGEISQANLPSAQRVALWTRQHIHVLGRPEWVFVKLHTHGALPPIADALLGDAATEFHSHLASHYCRNSEWTLHYVTAREMVNVIQAAQRGESGNPGSYRDAPLRPPKIG